MTRAVHFENPIWGFICESKSFLGFTTQRSPCFLTNSIQSLLNRHVFKWNLNLDSRVGKCERKRRLKPSKPSSTLWSFFWPFSCQLRKGSWQKWKITSICFQPSSTYANPDTKSNQHRRPQTHSSRMRRKMFTDCHSSCGFIGFSIKAFCHKRNKITYALSRDANDVRKYFSDSVVMRIAFGITLATFSLPFMGSSGWLEIISD